MSDTPETKTRKQKVADWWDRHQDTVIPASMVTGIVALYGALYYFASKEYDKELAATRELYDWVTEQENSGNSVHQLTDGRFLVLSPDGSKEYFIK